MSVRAGGYVPIMKGGEESGVRDSTLDRVRGPDTQAVHGMWARRLGVALMCLALVTAATGWLGVHSRTVTATGDGYTLRVTYALVARSGLDVPLQLRISASEPITGDVVVAISADYFRMFESQGFYPQPSDTVADADTVYFTFSPPPRGNTMVIDYDAYIQPSAQQGKRATISVITAGVQRVSTTINTTLMP